MIRIASYLDIPPLLMLLSDMHEESPVDFGNINWEKTMRNVLTSIESGACFIAEHDGEVVGSVGGHFGSEWFTDRKTLGDLWFYVRPDNRATKAGHNLLTAFKQLGNETGVPVRMGHVFGEDVDRKDAFFERHGFKRIGTSYAEGM